MKIHTTINSSPKDLFLAANSLAGLHGGDTLFLIGAGPVLNHLSAETRAALKERVTLGVNRTQYVLPLTYFISAYQCECTLALMSGNVNNVLHMRPQFAPPVADGIIPLQRAMYQPGLMLPFTFQPPVPLVYTWMNVMLGATHLALIMGARRIVYVAVEQNNPVHFYHEDEAIRQKLKADLRTLEQDGIPVSLDHPHLTYERLHEIIDWDVQSIRNEPFPRDNMQKFTLFLDAVKLYGIELIATQEKSLLLQMGAEYRPLDDMLSE